MEINLDNYYKRFGSEVSHADYKYLLFRSGDILQSTEMNDLQGIIKKQLSTVASGFYVNGSVLDGVEISIDRVENGTNGEGETLYDLTINYSEGILFVEEDFIPLEAGSISVTGQTEEHSDFMLGVSVTSEIVSAREDSSLLDPALETRNQGQPGANRLKKTLTLGVIDNDNMYEDTIYVRWYDLFRIKSLDIYTDPDSYVTDVEKKIVKISAEYDERSNGNYLLNGYETTFIGTTDPVSGEVGDNLGRFWFNIANGSANVGGYNYETFESSIFNLKKLIDFELHQSEGLVFDHGDGWYDVRHTPLRKVFRVSGEREELEFAMTHGSFSGAEDEVPADKQPIRSVSSVHQSGTTFVAGVDYTVTGDSINWLASADNEPAPNSTYYIDFKFQYTENEGGFSINGAESMGQISPDLKQIYLYGFSAGSLIQYDYDFILKRNDVIAIDTKGSFVSVKGIAAETNPKAPEIDTEKLLKIATVILYGDQDPDITIDSNRTFKMSDIQLILDTLKENQYNTNRIALELDLLKKQPGTHFKSQFVDDFETDDHRDAGLTQTALTIAGNLVMDIDWETILPNSSAYPTTEEHEENFSIGKAVLNPAVPVFSQEFYTGSTKINKYLRQAPPPAAITLTPKVYRWIDRKVYKEIQKTQIYRRPYYYSPYYYYWGWWGYYYGGRWTKRRTTSTTTSISTTNTPAIIPDNVEIKISSNTGAFNGNEDVHVLFNEVDLGDMSTDNEGTLDSSFIIPSGTISGQKLVTVEGTESGALGSTGFLAEPQTQTVTKTITETWRWVQRSYYWWWYYPWYYGWYYYPRWYYSRIDPLAQTFNAPKNMTVDSLEVIFEKPSMTDVDAFIVETTNGYPNSKKVLSRTKVLVADLVAPGERQRFTFTDPAYLVKDTSYAFILLNGDPDGEIQTATMGEKTLDGSNKWLTDPAYQTGVLFSSANNSTWEADQISDARFWLYERTFNSSRNFVFEFSVENATDLMVAAGSEVKEKTSVSYKVTLHERSIDPNNTLPWSFGVAEYQQFPLEEKFTGTVVVEVLLETEDQTVTPTLEADVQLGVGYTSRISEYTSVGFDISDSDEEAVAYIDMFEPNNTGMSVYLQIVDPVTKNVSWVEMTRNNNPVDLGREWKEVKFTLPLKPGGTSIVDVDQTLTRVKIEMNTANDNDRPVAGNLRLSINKI